MALALSLAFGFFPMFLFAWFVYWLDHYEKEPRTLLGGLFFWGAVIAAGGAYLFNTFLGQGVYWLTESSAATSFATGTLIAPVVEESLKGFAVLLVYLIFRREFDSIIDGIVYAGIVALGFAATENTLYIYRQGFLQDGYQGLYTLAFIRVVIVGWQHPFYTAFTGIGFSISRLSRQPAVKLATPILGWMGAVFAHSLHNTLASVPNQMTCIIGSLVDWSGWIFMLLFILWSVRHEQQLLAYHLSEEVALGVLTPSQYRATCSVLSQGSVRLGSIFAGQYRDTRRFYQALGEIAHKKQHLATLGEEEGNSESITRLRQELVLLKDRVYPPSV
ncbi:MAG TPA: PrsW family intramembrane metalloprotease [Anaerolineales bacterium]|nr:PrsW family intramembrane metalloprotease [Anaerolineales bacterium]